MRVHAGTIVDMKELGVWEPYEVKAQTIKTAIESATLLLRIDDIVSGIQKKNKMAPGQSSAPQTEDPDQVCRALCCIVAAAPQHSDVWRQQRGGVHSSSIFRQINMCSFCQCCESCLPSTA